MRTTYTKYKKCAAVPYKTKMVSLLSVLHKAGSLTTPQFRSMRGLAKKGASHTVYTALKRKGLAHIHCPFMPLCNSFPSSCNTCNG